MTAFDSPDDAVLTVEGLEVVYRNGVQAARGVSFEVAAGECLALVGDSGCGKTTIALAILGLLPPGTRVAGSIRLAGTELVGAPPSALRALRGRAVGFVAQNPFESCDPLYRVGTHVAEAWRAKRLRPPPGTEVARLAAFGIADPASAARRYPHQWSGGMLQRATIAAASAHRPPLLVADEPTSALDADRADATLAALRATGAALLLISHNARLVARHATRVAACAGGRILEVGPATSVLSRRRPPPGGSTHGPPGSEQPAVVGPVPAGTRAPAKHAFGRMRDPKQPEGAKGAVVEACDLQRTYGHGRQAVQALVSAGLRVNAGEIVGICGPSGSGKSTLLRLLATVEAPTDGELRLDGNVVAGPSWVRRAPGGFVMPVSQNPYASLDPRWPLWRTLTEPLTAPHLGDHPSTTRRQALAREWLDGVGLGTIGGDARPATLSGGEAQRVAILRALAARPRLLLADEPTSALDASVADTVLAALTAAATTGAALVVVSHDEATLRSICHRIGRMVEGVLRW